MSAMPIDRSLDNPTSAEVLGMGFFGASDAEKQDRMNQALLLLSGGMQRLKAAL